MENARLRLIAVMSRSVTGVDDGDGGASLMLPQ